MGLVGSVCSGKSTVSAEFERLGARVHRSDDYVHELLWRREVVAEVTEALGDGVLDESGAIDRARLGATVFGSEKKLKALEAILHPRTGARIRELVAALRRTRACAVLLVDAPLLVETGRHADVDRLLVVDAPLERRQAWAAASRNWDAGALARREARLIPVAKKKEMADYVIENDSDTDELARKVQRLWKELT